MKNIITAVTLMLSLFFNFSKGQTFTLVDSVPDGAYGTAAWGDFNNDGFKDLVYISQVLPDAACKIYTFDGTAFSEINQQLPLLYNAGACWGDLNNDGFDDLVVNGMDSVLNSVTYIYQSNGNGTFTPVANTITGLSAGSVDIADYNNDGWKDIAVMGTGWSNDFAYIYKNTGAFNFVDINAQLLGGHFSELKWGDYNNDGLKDLLINAAGTPFNEYAKIYKNMGADSFLVQNIYMKGSMGTADWCDFDNDGWQDILISGMDSTFTHNFTELHHNNHDETFTVVPSGLPDFGEPSSADIGDFDNNNFPDVCFVGGSSAFQITSSALSFNQGNNQFISQPFVSGNIINAIVAVADYDNDGDDDIFFCRYFFRNDGVTAIEENLTEEDVAVYPNPAPGIFQITSKQKLKEIIIYNCIGAEVKQISCDENKVTVDAKELPGGLYYIKANTNVNSILMKKLIVR
jgi:hypothetical protein